MTFNSIEFLFFLPIVFLLYWFVFDKLIYRNKWQLRFQNAFIVVASYIFYGWWDWRFLLLIIFTSFCSWGSGVLIQSISKKQITTRSVSIQSITKQKKLIVIINVVINLAILATFKYYDFFASEIARLLHIPANGIILNVILPVGISFYTFQALSYTIDVYRQKIEPTKDIIAFFAFISFFPQLVAGPIERANNLLPQFLKKRDFDYNTAVDGCRQIIWGLFKKIVVADNCASLANQTFDSYNYWSSSVLLVGALFFAFQIYGDFSGYSDIAIGTAKLFGIKLMRNFNVPYFSRDIAEFWRRWHISLNTWFRDYVYIPLGGSRTTKIKIIRNTFIIFLLCSLWHGANWTFIVWGAYNALLFLPLILSGRNRKYTGAIAEHRILPTLKESLQMLLTFTLTVIGWIIFRAKSISDAINYFVALCDWDIWRASYSFFSFPATYTGWFIVIMIIVEWTQRKKEHGLDLNNVKQGWVRIMIYYILIVMMFLFSGQNETFIYFQF